MKLGKRPPRLDARTLRLAKYVRALPPPPPAVDWTPDAGPWGMMLNDRIGDCTIAGAAHLIQLWTGNANPPAVIIPDLQVLAAYEQVGGYNPQDPSTDQGCVELDVLNFWRQQGIGGHRPVAYVSVNPKNISEVQLAIAWFGGVYAGVALPLSAQEQAVWDVTPSSPGDAGSLGGHAIPLVSYGPDCGNGQPGPRCVTWAALKGMTWNWWTTYADEAYALVAPDWIEAAGGAPSGFDLATLLADLQQIREI
jgi:hypothetical protein